MRPKIVERRETVEEGFSEAVKGRMSPFAVQRKDLTIRRRYEAGQPAGVGSRYRSRAMFVVVSIVGRPACRDCLSRRRIAVHCCAG